MKHDSTLNALSKGYKITHPMADAIQVWPTSHTLDFADVTVFSGTRVFPEVIPELGEYAVTLCDWWTIYKGIPMWKVEAFIDIHKGAAVNLMSKKGSVHAD